MIAIWYIYIYIYISIADHMSNTAQKICWISWAISWLSEGCVVLALDLPAPRPTFTQHPPWGWRSYSELFTLRLIHALFFSWNYLLPAFLTQELRGMLWGLGLPHGCMECQGREFSQINEEVNPQFWHFVICFFLFYVFLTSSNL